MLATFAFATAVVAAAVFGCTGLAFSLGAVPVAAIVYGILGGVALCLVVAFAALYRPIAS